MSFPNIRDLGLYGIVLRVVVGLGGVSRLIGGMERLTLRLMEGGGTGGYAYPPLYADFR